MPPDANPPTILQVLPRLETGGVERGTVEIADATPESVERRMARMRRLTPTQRAAYLDALEAMLGGDTTEATEAPNDHRNPALPPDAPGGA